MATRDMDAVELGIDERLIELREMMFEGWARGSDDIEFVGALLRTAYAKGMVDSLVSPAESRRFLRQHGYTVPR